MNHQASAFTMAKIGYHITPFDDSVMISVSAYMLPCRSWITPKPFLLLHEQVHFNINEYFRRVFIRKLTESNFSPTVLSTIAKAILKDVSDQKKKMEQDFDRETLSGKNTENENKWQSTVANLLRENEAFNVPYKMYKTN